MTIEDAVDAAASEPPKHDSNSKNGEPQKKGFKLQRTGIQLARMVFNGLVFKGKRWLMVETMVETIVLTPKKE